MTVEAFVFDSNEGFTQMLWDQIPVIDLNPVGIDADVLVDFVAFTVVNNRGFPGSYHIAESYFRGGSQDSPEHTNSGGYTADDDADHGSNT